MKRIKQTKKEHHLLQWSPVLLKPITFKDKHAKMISIQRVALPLSRCWGQAGFQAYTEQILPLLKLGYWFMTDLWPACPFFSAQTFPLMITLTPTFCFQVQSTVKALKQVLKILTLWIVCAYFPHMLMKTIISKQKQRSKQPAK